MARTAHLVGIGFVEILLATCLWAQGPPASPTSAQSTASPVTVASVQAPTAPVIKPHDNSFVVGNDDLLAINVWKEPDISRQIPVRSDGRISLPLVGEVQAAGRTPLQLEQDIAGKLRNYIDEPEVTVMVQQINSEKFNILGQVVKPGSYSLAHATTVLDAIAVAGGFRDFAKQKRIYILRQNPNGSESRLAFNYKNVIEGKNSGQNIKIEPHDTIVVP